MLIKRLNFFVTEPNVNAVAFVATPSSLFGFLTSINANGIPFIKSVMSGPGRPRPFGKGSSVATLNRFLSAKSLRDQWFGDDVEVRRL